MRTLRPSEIVTTERKEISFFHTREFFELFRDANNVRASSFTLTEGEKEIGGFSAFTIRSIAAVPARMQSRCTIFAPAWLREESEERAFYRDALPQLAERVKHESLFAEWRMEEKAEGLAELFASFGWTYVPYQNYLVPLDRDVERIWMSFDPNTRNSIRPREGERAEDALRSAGRGRKIVRADSFVV